jgi:hypothetical protein
LHAKVVVGASERREYGIKFSDFRKMKMVVVFVLIECGLHVALKTHLEQVYSIAK